MPAERCSDCGINWPIGTKECGVCMGELDHFAMTASISAEEAKRLTTGADFERFYDKREKEREKAGDPTPEALGALDAQSEIQRVRMLRRSLSAIRDIPEAPDPL